MLDSSNRFPDSTILVVSGEVPRSRSYFAEWASALRRRREMGSRFQLWGLDVAAGGFFAAGKAAAFVNARRRRYSARVSPIALRGMFPWFSFAATCS